MQLARTIFERLTARAVFPLINLGISGAIAAVMMEIVKTWREARVHLKR